MKVKQLSAVTVMAALSALTAHATTTIVLDANDAQNGPPANGSASIDTTSSQAYIGSGSWQANGTAASQFYLYDNANAGTQDGLGQLTVNDLTSLSFATFNTVGGASQPNWYLTIYTAPYAGGESWYGNRLVMEPYLANNNAGQPANQWNVWSTAAGANQLTINDTGGRSGNLGYYGQPTLANLQSGPINWSTSGSPGGSNTAIDYGDMNILAIVLSTGSAWAPGFTGLVDDVNIDSTAGNVQFDLEVPEPSTYVAGVMLLLPFGASMLRVVRRSRMA